MSCAVNMFTRRTFMVTLRTDYGLPLMVLVWTAIQYIPANNVPHGILRRLLSLNPWSPGAYANWTVIEHLNLHSKASSISENHVFSITISDSIMWSSWCPPIKWRHPTIYTNCLATLKKHQVEDGKPISTSEASPPDTKN
ncbi:hypothetical protein C5167_005587 [Papaver somniferum]|uniref:Uncharacterized protein n=1 Tax=Papaver somniferum TaxID=3469 RepID=A0A4Y7JAX6_PAPSO|nr:hypothetical protein C5167_005587 [Papaver somniferum]